VNEVPARAGSGVSAEAPPATANRRVPPRFAVPLLLALRIVCKRSRRLKIVCIYLEGNHEAPPSLRSLLRKRRPST